MFDIGLSEISLVLIIGLLVLGPERLPIAIRTVAKWIKSLRELAGGMQQVLAQELKINELQHEIRKLGESATSVLNTEMQSELSELRKTVAELKQQLNETAVRSQTKNSPEAEHSFIHQLDSHPEVETHNSINQPNDDVSKNSTLFGVPIIDREHEADEDDDYYHIEEFYEPEQHKPAVKAEFVDAHQALLNDKTNRLTGMNQHQQNTVLEDKT